MRSTPGHALQTVRESASFPLVPFSNRIGYGTMTWSGATHQLLKNFAPESHTIHGIGWERPWTVLERSERYAVLSMAHTADTAWPFDFGCTQTFELRDGALDMHLTMTNQGAAPAPAGLGWHPYFVKRPDAQVQFDAGGRWEMAPDKLPTHREPHPGLNQATADLTVDHCFDGWGGVLTLRDSLLRVTVRSALSRLVVFTTPQRDNIAVEPVSHVNNALNLMATTGAPAESLGIVVLQPGESWSCSMRVEVDTAQKEHV